MRGRLVDGKGGGGEGLLYAGEELEWSVPLAQGELYRGEGGQGLPPTALPYCNTQLIKKPRITPFLCSVSDPDRIRFNQVSGSGYRRAK